MNPRIIRFPPRARFDMATPVEPRIGWLTYASWLIAMFAVAVLVTFMFWLADIAEWR